MSAPLFEALTAFSKQEKISFHMPGHKNGKGINADINPFSIDVTELVGTDNLHGPETCILAAEKAMANAVGACESFFGVNGATGAMLAAIFAVCRRGDTILVNQNAHGCVLSAAVLLDLTVVFYDEPTLATFQIPQSVSPQTIAATLLHHPEAKAVVITSPNYYGIVSDIDSIAKPVHKFGKILIVDEAHGAHFPYSDILPNSAVTSGADLVVQSTHKTLMAPTQSALLHRCSERVSSEDIMAGMHLFLSSSPSYILMAYMDWARDWAQTHGKKAYPLLCRWIDDGIKQVETQTEIRFLTSKGCFAKDPTRIVANIGAYAISAKEVERNLQEKFGMYIEMADEVNLVLIATPANTKEELDAFFAAILCLEKLWTKAEKQAALVEKFPKKERICRPASAFYEKAEWVLTKEAVGRVSKQNIAIYPPNTPIVAAGELIDRLAVDAINRAMEKGLFVTGVNDGKVAVLIR